MARRVASRRGSDDPPGRQRHRRRELGERRRALTEQTGPRTVRTRFAPSPTGDLHVGTTHTGLFNWLFTRHHGGTVVLRIEDTDRKRLVKRSLGGIPEALAWLGIDWDEGPGVEGPY